MNIRDLKYIVNLAKEGHFARAAEVSFVSQPALSMQIKKLEDELGVKIFERSQKNFLVTDLGKKIIEKAEVILREVDDLKEVAKSAADPLAGEIKIGAFPTLAPYFFPKFIRKISTKFPRLKVFLIEEKTEILLQKLNSGEIDMAFIAMPVSDPALISKKIFSEKFLLAVPKDHRLAKLKKVQQKDLKGESLMLLEDGHCLRDQALEACSMIGALEYQSFRATSLETLKQMIAAGNGITFVPEIAASSDKRISYLPIANAPERVIGLCWRKSFSRESLAKEIAGLEF